VDVKPEIIDLEDGLRKLEISKEGSLWISLSLWGLLITTRRIKGIGPKKA